jgi:murein DD-endopeptidase MepM/ murein hydrolase activator NlpD
VRRPSSPILHDYKPSAHKEARNKHVLPWFIAGLGLPLVTVSLYLALGPADEDEQPAAAFVTGNSSLLEVASIPVAEPALALSAAAQPEESAITEAVAVDGAESAAMVAGDDIPILHPPLALPPEFEKLTLTINRGDTLDRLFRRNKLDLGDLATMVQLPDAAPHLKKLIPGDELVIEHDDGKLMSLYREVDLTNVLKITRQDDGFGTEMIERPLEVRRRTAHGRIDTNLFESATGAGLPDKTVMNLAGIFAWDVDFVLDIRSGDDYYVLYEQLYQDGEYIGDGEIIAAEFNNNGRNIQAIRFVNKDGRSDYFTPDGKSLRKAFLRAPVDFRVSSSFNPNRLHPVLKTVRPHRGTDYAAPMGTPIKATGDGKVIFRGQKSGYGNVVILQHGGNITTLYAHMSKFVSNVRNGTRVRQGQTIGYVGKSGLVTGVHLHYEYRLNGVHRNSRTVKLPQADPIPEEYREDFLASVEPILDELLQTKRTKVAALSAE